MTDDIFAQQHAHTQKVVQQLKASLTQGFGDQYSELIGDHTCVYATGSCGRGEMGASSDLDAYVVRVDGDELTHSAQIEAVVRAANIAVDLPALDGDGKYLKMVDAKKILDRLGAPNDDDDPDGVFTKRILLMLESRVLAGEPAHDRLLSKVLDAYWQNETLHTDDYLPVVLVNDIVRYWRIVLLNHESRLRARKEELQLELDTTGDQLEVRLMAERRYSSYKLRLPRCLSCFSALTYLLALTPTEPAHVTKEQVREMIALPPVERLRRLPDLVDHPIELVDQLLSVYGSYLEQNNVDKRVLVPQLQHDEALQRKMSQEGGQFTQLMFKLVQELGGGRPLHRHMVV